MTTSTGAVSKNAVIIKQLRADHGQQGFKNFRPLNPEMVKEVEHGGSRYLANYEFGLVREEMARTLKDVILRRTGIGTLGYPGDEVVGRVATIVARELDWDDGRREQEISLARAALSLPQ